MKNLTFIFLLVCACNCALAQTSIIKTIVNVDTIGGFNGDNIRADTAKLYFPEAVCFDKQGNLLIADVFTCRIRKVDMATNIITTIAGMDTFGFLGDNVLATHTSLNLPVDVFVDTFGDVYIADINNYRIRKVTIATGVITTVVGNGTAGYSGDHTLAVNAEIDGGSGVYVKKNGDLIFTDYYNNVVRKVDASTGIITTIAGTGTSGYSGDNHPAVNAEFDGPQKVSCDHEENIYISDQWNGVVRRIDATTGIITTYAGNGTSGYSGDSGLAIHAELNRPAGLYFDSLDNLFITEFGNGIVRRVDRNTGIISTVAGTGTWGYSGNGGPPLSANMVPYDAIIDAQGTMYIADYDNQCIRKIYNPTGIASITPKELTVSIYPNPTTSSLTISSPSTIRTISIINFLGQTVYTHQCYVEKVDVDISSLPSGIYLVRINDSEVRKFVKE